MTRKTDAENLLDCYWGPRARRSEEAHYFVATKFSAVNRGLSYAVVVFGVVTGSGLFATLSKQNKTLQLGLAVASLVAAGVDVRTVAGRLGHADPSTTLRIYAAFMEPADQGAARVIERLLADSSGGG